MDRACKDHVALKLRDSLLGGVACVNFIQRREVKILQGDHGVPEGRYGVAGLCKEDDVNC